MPVDAMTENTDWVDNEIAGGRYRVLDRIGEGSMGHIYLARDRNLSTDVVVKRPFISGAAFEEPEALERFDREIRSLVDLSHPHIVRIIDVGTHEGSPYVVMQYLSGGSLRDRMDIDHRYGPRPMAPQTLREWLPEVAKALHFIHVQSYVHRDVKPANILFDRYGNAFLSDFGIVKALASEAESRKASQLTSPGLLLGTPNYLAPELVLGLHCDGRADQYALAMTVHEVLTGFNCMEGPTPSATLVNQTNAEPPNLLGLVPGLSPKVAAAIEKALSKNPDDRFDDCLAFSNALMEGIPAGKVYTKIAPTEPVIDDGVRLRNIPCPSCRGQLSLTDEHVGERVLCPRCHCVVNVHLSKTDTMVLNLVTPPSASWIEGSGSTAGGKAATAVANKVSPSARTAQVAAPTSFANTRQPSNGSWSTIESLEKPSPGHRSRLRTWLLSAALLLVAAGTFLTLRREISGRLGGPSGPGGVPIPDNEGQENESTTHTAARPVPPAPPKIKLNIVYGTEKQKWLEEAIEEFGKTKEGSNVEILLSGMGSIEGMNAVLAGESGPAGGVQVWSPASTVVRTLFEADWARNHKGNPISDWGILAYTPMVFVMWKDRHDAFVKKYEQVDFKSLSLALLEPNGWETIAGKPEWTYFKFSHTDPNTSNSGMLALVSMAYEFTGKSRGLTKADVTDPKFRDWLKNFEGALVRQGDKLTKSTGDLMKEMINLGPSQYDGLLVYENLAIDSMQNAMTQRGDEGHLFISYPKLNLWSDHPFYVLNAPWCSEEQKKAAKQLLSFLRKEPMQLRAVAHGFRPGEPSIPAKQPGSPLVKNIGNGVILNLPPVCQTPPADVLRELLSEVSRK